MKEQKVTAAVLVDGGRVLIARRKYGHMAGFWEFPGGKPEDGETPEEGLARELQEELGITVQVGAFFGESVYRYAQGTVHLLVYWAAWAGGEIALRVHEEIRWVYPGQLAGYTFSPADRPLVRKLGTYGDDSLDSPRSK